MDKEYKCGQDNINTIDHAHSKIATYEYDKILEGLDMLEGIHTLEALHVKTMGYDILYTKYQKQDAAEKELEILQFLLKKKSYSKWDVIEKEYSNLLKKLNR